MATNTAKLLMAAWKAMGWTEDVVYSPGRGGAPARTITVIVDRGGEEALPQHGQAELMHVTAINGEPEGISSDPELSDVGADRLAVALRRGGTPATRGLGKFVQQDKDFVKVEIV